ncbi:MAG: hypothetical protein ACI80V_000602 [Rhodothermales bacterium]|jgi:hypothetical protein
MAAGADLATPRPITEAELDGARGRFQKTAFAWKMLAEGETLIPDYPVSSEAKR